TDRPHVDIRAFHHSKQFGGVSSINEVRALGIISVLTKDGGGADAEPVLLDTSRHVPVLAGIIDAGTPPRRDLIVRELRVSAGYEETGRHVHHTGRSADAFAVQLPAPVRATARRACLGSTPTHISFLGRGPIARTGGKPEPVDLGGEAQRDIPEV